MTELERKIYHEQIRLIYNQGPVLVAGATFTAVFITLFLWRHLPQSTLLLWLAAVGLSTLLRIWVICAYLKADEKTREQAIWGPFFWLGTLTAGMIWCIWPMMFYQLYSTEYLLLISTIFAGMVAVSAASGSIYLPSFLSFSIPLVLPLAVAHILSGNESLVLTGFLLIMFLAVNFFLAVRGHRQYRKLIRSQFENVELMERLAGEKRIAERAVIAKSRFLAAASHDLRQPLHAMGLFLSALRHRETDPTKLEILNDMNKSAQALNGLFNSLLDVSRLDAEIIEFNPKHLVASEMFDGLRAQFMQQTDEKGVSLNVDAGQHVFFSDAILLERVLRNLLSNAVQYTSSGGIYLRCDEYTDGAKLVTLCDTGIGIPEEAAEDVFSEYYQLNNPARDRSKGLGLGLAIVRRLCDLMDMPLEMESVEGQGTLFRIVVPGGDPAQVLDVSRGTPTMQATGRRVLVIDDEVQVLQSMRHMLESWGCEVMLAESARNALKLIALTDAMPEVIVSDYRLRDNLNGVDAVAAIRESLESEVPAIIITGDTSPERLKDVSGAGMLVMHKPVNPDELHSVIYELFASLDEDDPAAGSEVSVGDGFLGSCPDQLADSQTLYQN
ncbi:ATP-binding protein [Granulosicoccus antarcticus]|uniref:histidine kinase n=1 Tax=Granulosicoccus antarcticus IMCC3135 TaxID=1192854 RepID=A0A2Z2NJA0_9GAMM|nr:ATP-binding protein [Granulosicoccus antarcticus]ASJ71249.1 Autoinducer 2 sensor kinase/phosphatase LuxQ [Granulosicoccus antarcticus IMCC3135]